MLGTLPINVYLSNLRGDFMKKIIIGAILVAFLGSSVIGAILIMRPSYQVVAGAIVCNAASSAAAESAAFNAGSIGHLNPNCRTTDAPLEIRILEEVTQESAITDGMTGKRTTMQVPLVHWEAGEQEACYRS
jgi:hypothetical protein